jgi:hypothetical protein
MPDDIFTFCNIQKHSFPQTFNLARLKYIIGFYRNKLFYFEKSTISNNPISVQHQLDELMDHRILCK